MAFYSIGKVTVTTAGTKVRLTANETTPGANLGAQTILIQALSGNTGKVYIGLSTLNKSTGAGVLGVLNVPPTTGDLPLLTLTAPMAPALFNAADLYLDVDTNGEGVMASLIQG